MIISITSLRLRNLLMFFPLTFNSGQIVVQTKKSKGFLQLKHTGFGLMHYTMTMWESEQDMKAFAHSGAHLKAMRQTQRLSSELRVYTFQGNSMPKWEDAKKLLEEKGRVLKFK